MHKYKAINIMIIAYISMLYHPSIPYHNNQNYHLFFSPKTHSFHSPTIPPIPFLLHPSLSTFYCGVSWYKLFQKGAKNKNMFKVVLILKSLSVRLRECECDVVLSKNHQNLTLCSKVTVLHGNCPLNAVRQFYLDSTVPKVALVLYLLQGQKRHFGGEVSLSLSEWEQNVIHTVESKLANSPDRDSCLRYRFYFFKDETVSDRRSIFLSQARHAQEYNTIQITNRELKGEKDKLEQEVYHWHKKNEALQSGRQSMVDSFALRESHLREELQHCKESMHMYSEQLGRQRETREGLMRLAVEHGLGIQHPTNPSKREKCFL